MRPTDIASKSEVRLSRLVGAEARHILKANPVILLPMGSHEDQGPHCPMGDYMLAERIAKLSAELSQNNGTPTFVAPVIPYGAEDYFRSSVGGAVLEHATLVLVILDILKSFIENGLSRIIIVNGHSGNVNPIAIAMRKIHRKHGIIVPSVYLWEAAYGMLPDIVGPAEAAKRSGHGADPLGSVGRHLMPELIRDEYVPQAKSLKTDPLFGLPFVNVGKVRLGNVEIGVPYDYADVYHDGVASGDPQMSDAVTGAELSNRLVATVSDLAALMFTK